MADAHDFDIVLNGVDLLEIEPTHGVQLLIGGSLFDCNRLFDKNLPLLGQTIRFRIGHVDNGMRFPVIITKTMLRDTLAVIGVDGPIG